MQSDSGMAASSPERHTGSGPKRRCTHGYLTGTCTCFSPEIRQQANACTMPRPKYGPLPDRIIQGGVHSATASRQVTPSVLRYTHMCSVKRVPRDPPGAAQHGDLRGEPHFTHSSSARGMTASWARSLTAQRMSLPPLMASRRTLISSSARVAFPKTHRNSPVRKRGAGASKRHRHGTDATRDAETYILISLVP